MEELMKDGDPLKDLDKVNEPTVQFRLVSDRSVYEVRSEAVNAALVEISGYDLQMNFNMQYLNSTSDIEDALEGLKDLFRDVIMEQVMANKARLEGLKQD